LNTVCAWCSRDAGRIDPPGTSHGICALHSAIELNKIKAEQIEREIDRCETRMRRKFHAYAHSRIPVSWDEDEPVVASSAGKRSDQLAFSVFVVVVAIGFGIIAGSVMAAWRFAP
jgi:hypothetical protein